MPQKLHLTVVCHYPHLEETGMEVQIRSTYNKRWKRPHLHSYQQTSRHTMELKRKNYMETTETLDWLTKNVGKQKESEFIRDAVEQKIKKIDKTFEIPLKSTIRKKELLLEMVGRKIS